MKSTSCFVSFAALALSAQSAVGAFTGQPILGPLVAGSSVFGDNTGAGDENDGFFSGDHIFDIWDGGDDVYRLDWAGGDLTIDLIYNDLVCDPDLFLYTPGNPDESSFDNILGTSPNTIEVLGAAAGTYFILIDSTAGSEGAYQLSVRAVPAPGVSTLALVGLGGLVRRSRRVA